MSAMTGVLRTGVCPRPNLSATPMWPRSEQTVSACSMRSTGGDAPPAIAALPAVAVLRRVWARHFERAEAGPDNGEATGDKVRLRPAQGRGPGDRIESPYDSEARFRTKAGTRACPQLSQMSVAAR